MHLKFLIYLLISDVPNISNLAIYSFESLQNCQDSNGDVMNVQTLAIIGLNNNNITIK